MDDDVRDLLRQILIVQQEQAAILKRYLPPLWTRIRFTLFGLFVVTTVVAIGMGLVVSRLNSSRAIPAVRPSLTPPPMSPYMPPPYAPPIRVPAMPSRQVLPESTSKAPVGMVFERLPHA
jgi:hypothetical protein